MHMLSSDTTVDMIYLDFSKAFDKVDHGVLLHKLKDLGITGKLGIWFFQWCSTTMSAVDFERRLEGGRGVEIWVMELWGVFLQFFIKPLMYD